MKRALCLILPSLLAASAAHAQWVTEDYTLKGGWNSIYLHGDASYAGVDSLLSSGPGLQVQEIWRWNPNPTQIQFTESPLLPSAGTPEWSVWKRGLPAESTLSRLTGQTAYLVRCTGTTANSYAVPLRMKPLVPGTSWVRNGANLLGFPSLQNGPSYPSFSSYFSTFPAAIAANTKIFKYAGGDLGPGNPVQVFSTGVERVDRHQAYWFDSEVVGNFYAPVEIDLSSSGGIAFGRTGSVVTARIRNRGAATVNVTLTPLDSEPAPAGEPGITGMVPLTRRTLNPSTLTWTETPVTGALTETIGPQSTVEVHFGIDRASMSGAAADAVFASLLRVADSANQMNVYLPVTAQKSSLSGLWVGDISLTNVSSQVSNAAQATAAVTNGSVTTLTITGSGGFGYPSPPAVTIADPLSGSTATAAATVAAGSVTSLTITSGGSGYAIASPRVTIAPPPPLPGTATAAPFSLRAILHVADNGTASLLSRIFLGELAASPGQVGLCTAESLLRPESKASAQRLSSAHLPPGQIISSGSGSVTLPGALTRTITVPFNDPSNPFVHQYHPDHDNKDPRGNPLTAGVESYNVTRTCTFTFTASPPPGSTTTTGWGSSVIGGTYREILHGLHKNDLQMDGTFELRRASEIGTLTMP